MNSLSQSAPSVVRHVGTEAYLVVVGERGVERLTPETEHAARFLARRCYGSSPIREVLWWATLTPQAAATIRYLVDAGLHRLALECLAQTAQRHGSLPPTESPTANNRPAA